MADRDFPPRIPGRLYLTEGGIETEIMYKYGHDLPEFSMYPLLDNPQAVSDMEGVWRRYLDVAKRHGFVPLCAGLDYRASPDWAAKIGYSRETLAEFEHRNIAFLRRLIGEFDFDTAHVVGGIGPRGDAYGTGEEITADDAAEYHGFQLQTLKDAGADLAWAMTFNNIPEAIGIARAADAIGIPLAVSFGLTPDARLRGGAALREAIETIDGEVGDTIAFFAVNCAHPVEIEPAFDGGEWQHKIRGLRPNASRADKLALCKIGHLEDGDPVELGQQMGDLARRFPQMDIFGACCGADERHLDEIARAVKAVREGVTA
jgi:homocysteine S-methyltransferase